MKSGLPSPDDVVAQLGDKVVSSLGKAVSLTRNDLSIYRRTFPAWVAAHTARGLANWCHDRMWDHVAEALVDVHNVVLVDRPPLREIHVGVTHRLRLKKHDELGRVSTVLTQLAIEFMEQPQPTFPGMETIHLIAGYEWDEEMRDVGRAVLSLRDGMDVTQIYWVHQLEEPQDTAGAVAQPIRPLPIFPPQPDIRLPDGVDGRTERGQDPS